MTSMTSELLRNYRIQEHFEALARLQGILKSMESIEEWTPRRLELRTEMVRLIDAHVHDLEALGFETAKRFVGNIGITLGR